MRRKTFQQLAESARDTAEYQAAGMVLDITEAFIIQMAAHGINRRQLARKIGVSQAYVTKFFRGQNFTVETIAKFAHALGVTARVTIKPKATP